MSFKCFFFLQRCVWVFLVIHKIWVYGESWIGLLQWAQGMLQSQDFISSVLSGLWTGGLKQVCNLQITGRTGREDYSMEEFWSAKGRAVWKECFSKGLTVSAVAWEGCSSTCASPGVSKYSWSSGSRDWLGRVTNSSGNQKNIWEVAGKPSLEICFVLHLVTPRGILGGSSLPALSSGRPECFGLCPNWKVDGGIVLPMWAGHTADCLGLAGMHLGSFTLPEFWHVFLLKSP